MVFTNDLILRETRLEPYNSVKKSMNGDQTINQKEREESMVSALHSHSSYLHVSFSFNDVFKNDETHSVEIC